jgi:hypothetical protein
MECFDIDQEVRNQACWIVQIKNLTVNQYITMISKVQSAYPDLLK